MNVRIHHFWYDGPLVAAEVEVDGEWVGCNVSPIADELEALLAWANVDLWPEGDYVFADGQLTPAFKPREETAS